LNSSPARDASIAQLRIARRGTLEELNRVAALDRAMRSARGTLANLQDGSGYWAFELEADCTIPAEYIMMLHYLGELDPPLEAKLAAYLRARQADHGGWPLYHGGDLDISCTVKAYFALKLAGDSPDAPHMARARAAILERGGAARANVFTRIALALFGELPWRGVPYIPVEIMLMPGWFPFNIGRVSYWSRTVMVPLFILTTYKPVARNPRNIHIRELFSVAPERERHYFQLRPGRNGPLAKAFLLLDHCVRHIDRLIPKAMRRAATRRAEAWILERLNGEDGLGAIFPAMVNALEAMILLGYPRNDERVVTARRALEKLLVVGPSSAYCQPCVSPIWDTGLAVLALQGEGGSAAAVVAERALSWLQAQQILDGPADWQVSRPALAPGGWAFQYGNSFYPDLDDTAVIIWGMCQSQVSGRYTENINRALTWLVGMQCRNGGFAAFDVDNTHYNLNHTPFADHGALLDPPTSDVTARVVTAFAVSGRPEDKPALRRAIEFLRKEQEPDGSWFGRWGTNYVYGTWSVLVAFANARVGHDDEAVRRGVKWLQERQNADGGWGESNDSYSQAQRGPMASTAYQTAWALLALIASGEAGSDAVRSGIDYLLRTQQADGLWGDPSFTAPGFPRVFYLKYHGYCAYFPLWALAAYRKQARSGAAH
jgi:squalene-hopene/tetraprenyl-beta-curcumene cyclase